MTINRGAPLASFGLAAVLAACSSGSGGNGSTVQPASTGSPACNACDDGGSPTPTAAGTNPTPTAAGTNPDGIPYPSPATGYGRSTRSGSTPGSIIANFKFSGYPNAVVSPQLQPIAMADYYDPCGQRYKLIHLTVGALWCPPCNQETDAIEAAKQQLDSEGVVVLQALEDGNSQNVGATQTDLNNWIAKHHTTFTEMLDPDPNPQLGIFFMQASIPWNGDIDPRTMEILDSSPGWTGDIASELAPALAAVQGAPSYPLPAACNDL